MSIKKAEREVDHLFEADSKQTVLDAKEMEMSPTKYVADFKKGKFPTEGPEMDKIYIPTAHNITPFPDITSYDPTHYYENRPGYSEPLNPNKYYDSYRDTRPKPKLGMRIKYKQNTGRSTQKRICFSTVNKAEEKPTKVAFACQPSLAVAYTGLMRKIGN